MIDPLPYCGAAPSPGALMDRFNFDPIVLGALVLAGVLQWVSLQKDPSRHYAIGGWIVAAIAFLSPLCALSVSLFSARVAQHMILILVAAPLIALGLPRSDRSSNAWLWFETFAFFLLLWAWHMPVPYAATFTSIPVYWAMHVTLFGAAIGLWRGLLQHGAKQAGVAFAAGTVTFMHMGLLGAVLTFADHAMFKWHFNTTQVWGLTPLQDLQLGGIFMWVPGTALFLWVSLRSVARIWKGIERAGPA